MNFLVNLDIDNLVDPDGLHTRWCSLRSNLTLDTYSFQIVHWKGRDPGVTGRIGCFSWAFGMVRGYHGGLFSNGYEDLDILNRLNLLILDRFAAEVAPGTS